MKSAVETVLKKYLDAYAKVERLEEKNRVALSAAVGPGGAIDVVKWNSLNKGHLDATTGLKDERDYNLEALLAWHADPTINLMVWKLANPKP